MTGLAELSLPLIIDPQNPSTLYTRSGLAGGGVIKSRDGGMTWSAVNSGLGGTSNNAPSIGSLTIDPQNPNILYAARFTDITDNQIFRTTNGGADWSPMNLGWEAGLFHVPILVADPQNSGTLYAGTTGFDCGYYEFCPPDYYNRVAAGPGPGLFKTTDGGQSWTKLDRFPIPANTSAAINALAIDPRNSSTLYAALAYPGRVFRSMDGGATWNSLSSGLTASVTALAVDGQDPSTVYAATQGGGVFAITFAPQ